MNYNHKSNYAYPAVFCPEEEGKFHVYFPDFEGCFTCGDDLEDAMLMAADVLAFTIYEDYEAQSKATPKASALSSINVSEGQFVSFVVCDTKEYRRKFSKKAVKKTLSIPEWLNEAAVEENLNFSQILQDALKEKLQLH